jgi:fatty acid amide hydrolase 2
MAVAAPARPLTERSASDLARAIRGGEVSSREVVQAHVDRLRAVQPRLNALAAERFEAALAEAEAADNSIAAAGEHEALPPLLGVPCTIKESIALAGMPNCAGLLNRRDYRATETAPAAQRLLDAGAIPLAVTNTPELCLSIESHNHVYGRTRNAYDPRRVAGGSSGGEGAAVGAGGSPIGLGSDIAGSIRLPASSTACSATSVRRGWSPIPATSRPSRARWRVVGPEPSPADVPRSVMDPRFRRHLCLSTRHQWFALARLLGSHLPRSTARLSRDAHHHGS